MLDFGGLEMENKNKVINKELYKKYWYFFTLRAIGIGDIK